MSQCGFLPVSCEVLFLLFLYFGSDPPIRDFVQQSMISAFHSYLNELLEALWGGFVNKLAN